MPTEPASSSRISPSDMKVIDRVLDMGGGYVLDFSDRTFDEFIAHEAGIDATAPRYSVDGGSKAKRLRTILRSLGVGQRAKLLRALLVYRDHTARGESASVLDDEWRTAYEAIIAGLNRQVRDADSGYAASSWTGRRSIREQVAVVRGVAPMALAEIDALASLVEKKRFNDPITADAVECLRELHQQLGELLECIDRGGLTRHAVEAIEANRQKLISSIEAGAKLAVVAPAMTFGVIHILSWITGVKIDSQLVSTVYASMVGADVVQAILKNSSLAK